jgi:anti-anti-sigma regulatory factor
MLSTQALARPAAVRSVFVDLIGDLDATLGSLFADTLTHLAGNGTTDVHVTTRHIAVSTSDGLAAVDAALIQARKRGCSVAVDPGSRRMRAAFSAASIATLPDAATPAPERGRHLMIARHAPPPKLRKTA